MKNIENSGKRSFCMKEEKTIQPTPPGQIKSMMVRISFYEQKLCWDSNMYVDRP